VVMHHRRVIHRRVLDIHRRPMVPTIIRIIIKNSMYVRADTHYG
jgi:hypothetical protein